MRKRGLKNDGVGINDFYVNNRFGEGRKRRRAIGH